jgi:ERF superfamily
MSEQTDLLQDCPAPKNDGATKELVVPEKNGELSVSPGPGALLSAIIGLAKDPDFDVTKLQALMGMQERLEDRQAERSFTKALAEAQAEIPQVSRLGVIDLGTGKGGYNFARREDIDLVLRPIMASHGLSIHFDRVQREGGGLVVTGTLSHVDGHSKTSSFPLPLDTGPGRNNLQAAGSADHYAKRYIIEGFFNIVRKGKDDDGHAAGIKYVTEEQSEQIVAKLKEAGRQELSFIPKMCSDARSANEVETRDFKRVMDALQEIIDLRKTKS